MKKGVLAIAAIASAFAVVTAVPSNVHAQTTAKPAVTISPMATGWQHVGSGQVMLVPGTAVPGQIVESGGGDFRVDITTNRSGGWVQVKLYESDNGTNSGGTLVDGNGLVDGTGSVIFRDLSSWVDGSNGKAEFYCTFTTDGPTGLSTQEYYD